MRIGPFCHIGPAVRIGAGCVLGDRVSLMGELELGPGCRVHAGAVLGDVPQDLSFKGAQSGVRIGARCVIREGVTIHRGTKEETLTEIGEECFLMAFSHCAHNVKLGRKVILANGVLLGGYVEVGDGAFLSGNCAVHQFAKIGRLAMLGGCCGISKDVPPFCMTRTVGCNEVVGLNVVGMRRAGMNPEERRQVKEAFRILYRSGLNVTQAVNEIRGTFQSGPALEFCDFVASSERGICGAS